MNQWLDRRLGDVATLQRGFDLPDRLRQPGRVPVVTSSGENGLHSEAKVQAPGVVTGRYGTIGQVFFVERDFWPLNTTLWVKDFHGNKPRFIYYLLQSIDFESCNDKSGVPGLNRNDLHDIQVLVPSIADQRAIAATLGALDDKIDLNRQMNRTLEEMASALFRSWFIDFDPVTSKLEGRQPFGMDAATAALFPAQFEDTAEGPVPKGWERVSLRQAGQWVSGGTPTVERAEYWNGPIPWISAKTMHDRYVVESDRNVTTLGANNGTRMIPPKSVMFVVRGMSLAKEFRFATCDKELCINQDLKGIIPKRVPGSLLLAYLATAQDEILGLVDEASHGTTRLQTELVERLELVVPPVATLTTMAKRFDLMVEQSFANVRESMTLTALRDLLLPQLLSGEIRIKDAERLVEGVQ